MTDLLNYYIKQGWKLIKIFKGPLCTAIHLCSLFFYTWLVMLCQFKVLWTWLWLPEMELLLIYTCVKAEPSHLSPDSKCLSHHESRATTCQFLTQISLSPYSAKKNPVTVCFPLWEDLLLSPGLGSCIPWGETHSCLAGQQKGCAPLNLILKVCDGFQWCLDQALVLCTRLNFSLEKFMKLTWFGDHPDKYGVLTPHAL